MIGCGQWGRNIARNLASLNVLKIICDADEIRGAAMAKDLGVEFTTDLTDALSRPGVRGAAIATPAVTHAEVAAKALDAGRHVFVEKPISLSVSDAMAIAAKARASGLTLMTGHLLQYHPVFRRLLELTREGKFGRLQYVYSNRLNQGRIRTEENAIWSLAPHDISMILALAGEAPARVTANGHDPIQKGLPDLATVNMSFANGLRAHIFCSWLNPYKEHRLVVVGERGAAVFDDTGAWEDKLVCYDHRVEWEGSIPVFKKGSGERIAVEKSEPLQCEVQHFIDCLEGRAVCRTGPEEAIPVLEVLTAAQKSMDESLS